MWLFGNVINQHQWLLFTIDNTLLTCDMRVCVNYNVFFSRCVIILRSVLQYPIPKVCVNCVMMTADEVFTYFIFFSC